MGRFKKGELPPVGRKPWKKGESGNPSGKPKGIPTQRKKAINAMMDMIETVMAEPETITAYMDKFRVAIRTNPPQAMRDYILPFAPIVTQSVSQRGDDDPIRRMSVTQLKALAAEIPDDMTDADAEEVGPKVIDIPQDDT